MRVSRDKVNKLAHTIADTLAEIPECDFLEDRNTIRQEARRALEKLLTEETRDMWRRGLGGELPDRLRRGRPLLLQGTASTLADRLGEALAERASTASDGDRLRAALDEIRVGAFADAAGKLHRQGDER